MVKKTAFGISATVTFVIAAAAIWLLVGGGEVLAKSLIINPHYDRRVSQFQQLPVRAGDTVFLGVVKITDATSDVEHARPGEVADLARISEGLCWDARLPQPRRAGQDRDERRVDCRSQRSLGFSRALFGTYRRVV